MYRKFLPCLVDLSCVLCNVYEALCLVNLSGGIENGKEKKPMFS